MAHVTTSHPHAQTRIDSGGCSANVCRSLMSASKGSNPSISTWAWKAGGEKPPVAASSMDIRLKAVLQCAVMAAVGAFLFFWMHHRIGPAIVWSLAGLVLAGGLCYPPLFHGFERFGQRLGKWVAVGLTYALLVPFYYLIFVPAHLILRLRGVDPMCRAFPSKEPTYWIPRKPVQAAQYKKQH